MKSVSFYRRSAALSRGMRLTVEKVWGPDSKAHLYTVEYR